MSNKKIARLAVQQLTPYLSARRIGGTGDIWLNANESPFDNRKHLHFELTKLNRYPEPQPAELIQAYANYAGVTTKQVLVSRGADEGIELLIRTFCEHNKDSILICPPTYGMYSVSANIAEVNCKSVPLLGNWQLDLTSIESQLENVKLVFICNPNNPTGNLINSNDLLRLCEITKDRAIMVIDEAYIDFSIEASSVHLLQQYSHVAILRTLSKAFALAGLRCGFTLASPEIIELMLKVIAPYPIACPVSDIACQALSKEGIGRMQQQAECLAQNKQYFSERLAQYANVQVFPSFANFVLVKFADADALFEQLWAQGIIARRTAISHCIRFSIGTKTECDTTLAFITQYLARSE